MSGGPSPFLPGGLLPKGMGVVQGQRQPTRLELEELRRRHLRDQTASLAASLVSGSVSSGTVKLTDVDDEFIDLALEVAEAFFVRCEGIAKDEEEAAKQ